MRKILFTASLVLVLLATLVAATSCSLFGSSSKQTAVLVPATVPPTWSRMPTIPPTRRNYRPRISALRISSTSGINGDVQATEKDISVGLVQFDINSLKGKDIKSATLQMYVTSDSPDAGRPPGGRQPCDRHLGCLQGNLQTKPTWAPIPSPCCDLRRRDLGHHGMLPAALSPVPKTAAFMPPGWTDGRQSPGAGTLRF